MNRFLQVKQFDDLCTDNQQSVNDFLIEIGSRVVLVNPYYNSVIGCIQYVVTYWIEK